MRKLIVTASVAVALMVGVAACGSSGSAPTSADGGAPRPEPVVTDNGSPSVSTWTAATEDYAWSTFDRGAGGVFTDRACVLDIIEAEFPSPADLIGLSPTEAQRVGGEIAAACK